MIEKSTDNFTPVLIILEKHIAESFIKIAFDEDIQVNYGDVLYYFVVLNRRTITENEKEIDFKKAIKNYYRNDVSRVFYYDTYKIPSLEKLYNFIKKIPDNKILEHSEIICNFKIENTDFLKNNYFILNLIFKLLYYKYQNNLISLENNKFLFLEYYYSSLNSDDYNIIYRYFYCIDFYIKNNYYIYIV